MPAEVHQLSVVALDLKVHHREHGVAGEGDRREAGLQDVVDDVALSDIGEQHAANDVRVAAKIHHAGLAQTGRVDADLLVQLQVHMGAVEQIPVVDVGVGRVLEVADQLVGEGAGEPGTALVR